MSKKPVTIRAARITTFGVITAAIIGGVFLLVNKGQKGEHIHQDIEVDKVTNSPISNKVENQNINYYQSDTTQQINKHVNQIKNDSSPNSINVQGDNNKVTYKINE